MNFDCLSSVNQTALGLSTTQTTIDQKNPQSGNESVHVYYSSVELLPQDSNMIIKDSALQSNVAKMLSFFSLLLSDALYDFYTISKYHKFDPHVGDTACQIRAYQLIKMRYEPVNYSPNNRIDQLISISNRIDRFNNQNKELLKRLPLEDFINKNELMFHISSNEWLLLRMYFLTFFKEEGDGNTTYINYDAISHSIGVSRKLAKKIVRYYQISLAQSSCDIVLELARKRKSKSFNTILNETLRKDDDARPVLPCYFYSKLIFEELQIIKCDILIEISFETQHGDDINPLYLKFSSDGKADIFNLSSKDMLDDKIYFVITGTADAKYQSFDYQNYVRFFNQYGLYNIFLACMAAHPQYTGNILSSYQNSPFRNIQTEAEGLYEMSHELASMKIISEKYGCSLNNQSLLLIKHIYCDTLTNFLKLKSVSKLTNGVEAYG